MHLQKGKFLWYGSCIFIKFKKLKEKNTLKLLEERPDIKANADARLSVYRQALSYTRTPPWTKISRFDFDLAHKIVPEITKKVLDDSEFTESQKFSVAIEHLVQYNCNYQKWDEAEKWARQGIAYKSLNNNEKCGAYLQLAKVYRYQFRYDDAMKAVREAFKYIKKDSAIYGSDLAFEFGKPEDAAALWKEYGNEFDEIKYFAGRKKKAYIPRALAYVKDTKNPESLRYNLIATYFLDMSKEAQEARKAGVGLPIAVKARPGMQETPIKNAFAYGDFPLTVSLCEFYAGTMLMDVYNMQNLHVLALGAIGRKNDAAKFAAEYAKGEKLTPAQKNRFLAYEALMLGKDPEAVIKAAKLSRKEEAEIYLSLARHCLTIWHMPELAEKYSVAYEKYFAKPVERRMEVKYFDAPVRNIDQWRRIYSNLDKQYCDIPYKGSMDFLETDVATGDRGVVKAVDGAELEGKMELTALCDREGLHLFLRTKDSNARAIEQGFARGIGTEMYFAPGVNQPYVCMGSNPTAGVTFMFQTTYNNKNAQRPNLVNNSKTGFRSEVEFTDTDYVLHMFFGWDLYYNKLPAPGTDWRFDCLSWTKAGGFSWGGSQGIHSASAWGNLRFNLTDKQLNEIRKGILFRTFRTYKNHKIEPGVNENLFRIWQDPVIGDPVFFEKMLAPLEAELDAYAKSITADMTDAQIADVYSKALPRMKGLKHEIDELRRKYLSERITLMGE